MHRNDFCIASLAQGWRGLGCYRVLPTIVRGLGRLVATCVGCHRVSGSVGQLGCDAFVDVVQLVVARTACLVSPTLGLDRCGRGDFVTA